MIPKGKMYTIKIITLLIIVMYDIIYYLKYIYFLFKNKKYKNIFNYILSFFSFTDVKEKKESMEKFFFDKKKIIIKLDQFIYIFEKKMLKKHYLNLNNVFLEEKELDKKRKNFFFFFKKELLIYGYIGNISDLVIEDLINYLNFIKLKYFDYEKTFLDEKSFQVLLELYLIEEKKEIELLRKKMYLKTKNKKDFIFSFYEIFSKKLTLLEIFKIIHSEYFNGVYFIVFDLKSLKDFFFQLKSRYLIKKKKLELFEVCELSYYKAMEQIQFKIKMYELAQDDYELAIYCLKLYNSNLYFRYGTELTKEERKKQIEINDQKLKDFKKKLHYNFVNIENMKMMEKNLKRVYSKKKKKYNQIIDKILKNARFF